MRVYQPREAQYVLGLVAQLYDIEDEIRLQSPEARLAARQARSVPILDRLGEFLRERQAGALPKSQFGKAIAYTLNHWDGLTLFLSDGRVEVDSNTVERSMRPIALGRKNSLFAGSEGGAESWAILASLLNTAKLNDLDPQTYLTDVLERIVSGRTKSHQLHELLAWNWKAEHERVERAAA